MKAATTASTKPTDTASGRATTAPTMRALGRQASARDSDSA